VKHVSKCDMQGGITA